MASRWPAARAFVSRRRRWLVLLGVLVVLRAALPEVVRRVLVSQLSQRLRTRVDVGDVDLALHRGGVALEDVALYAPDAPGEPPVIAWKRFAVELRYLPLLWKTVQLRDIELERPRVEDRHRSVRAARRWRAVSGPHAGRGRPARRGAAGRDGARRRVAARPLRRSRRRARLREERGRRAPDRVPALGARSGVRRRDPSQSASH